MFYSQTDTPLQENSQFTNRRLIIPAPWSSVMNERNVINVTHSGIVYSHLTRFDFQWIRLVDCEQQVNFVILFLTGTIDNQWVLLSYF